jgi:hypothetical protein
MPQRGNRHHDRRLDQLQMPQDFLQLRLPGSQLRLRGCQLHLRGSSLGLASHTAHLTLLLYDKSTLK